MGEPCEHHQHYPTLQATKGYTSPNSSHNSRTMSSSTNALSTTSLESGYLTPTEKINLQLWEEFTTCMNNYPGLSWEFNARTSKVDFMDLTISITNGNISTSLFEKPLNLHLYIPPHSAHPPGLLPGIGHSTLFGIFTLCSDHDDRILRTKFFFKRLQARGYKSDHIKPLFNKATARAQRYSGPTDRATNDENTVILHLPFHPNDPPSHKI